jgi:hypothetical protein
VKTPSAEEAALFGLTVEEASGPPVEVWPDNFLPVNVFMSMTTQWRIGMNGVTGLDYSALEPVMRMMGVSRKKWPEVFQDIGIMEGAAMETIRKESA